jgi:hypothetical protein
MVDMASRVVTFGCLDRCPIGAEGKGEDWPVPGATGKSSEELRAIRDELSRRVDDLLVRLVKPDIEGLRRELVKTAQAHETFSYGQLMRLLGISRGRPLLDAISEVDKAEYANGAPGFAAIIVRKDTGYPGGGFFCDDDLPPNLRRPYSRASDPALSAAEMNYVKDAQRKIWAYYSNALT